MSVSQVNTQEVSNKVLLEKDTQVQLSFLHFAARLMVYADINKQFVTDGLKSIYRITKEQLAGYDSVFVPTLKVLPDGRLSTEGLSQDQVQSFLRAALVHTSVQLTITDNISQTYFKGILPLAEYPTVINEAVVPSVYALWLFFAWQHQRHGDTSDARSVIENNLKGVFDSVAESTQEESTRKVQLTPLLPVSYDFATWSLDLVALISKTLRLRGVTSHDASQQLLDEYGEKYSVL